MSLLEVMVLKWDFRSKKSRHGGNFSSSMGAIDTALESAYALQAAGSPSSALKISSDLLSDVIKDHDNRRLRSFESINYVLKMIQPLFILEKKYFELAKLFHSVQGKISNDRRDGIFTMGEMDQRRTERNNLLLSAFKFYSLSGLSFDETQLRHSLTRVAGFDEKDLVLTPVKTMDVLNTDFSGDLIGAIFESKPLIEKYWSINAYEDIKHNIDRRKRRLGITTDCDIRVAGFYAEAAVKLYEHQFSRQAFEKASQALDILWKCLANPISSSSPHKLPVEELVATVLPVIENMYVHSGNADKIAKAYERAAISCGLVSETGLTRSAEYLLVKSARILFYDSSNIAGAKDAERLCLAVHALKNYYQDFSDPNSGVDQVKSVTQISTKSIPIKSGPKTPSHKTIVRTPSLVAARNNQPAASNYAARLDGLLSGEEDLDHSNTQTSGGDTQEKSEPLVLVVKPKYDQASPDDCAKSESEPDATYVHPPRHMSHDMEEMLANMHRAEQAGFGRPLGTSTYSSPRSAGVDRRKKSKSPARSKPKTSYSAESVDKLAAKTITVRDMIRKISGARKCYE
ncbi:hypothetical protein HN587_02000 [Candidatus Woesearchaeota archaeon]|jgi:hypothetical protein|nr:hypothetical protein [Candidatus Woesearchaeota archaeon]